MEVGVGSLKSSRYQLDESVTYNVEPAAAAAAAVVFCNPLWMPLTLCCDNLVSVGLGLAS